MTTQFSSNAESSALTDDEIVQEVLAEFSPSTSIEFIESQNRLAWERDRSTIQDFFNKPSQYISAYWQHYKPVVMALLILASSLIAVNFLLSIIGIITGIPLVGGLLELVGLGYSVWFVRRYLLTAEARHELLNQIDQIKQDLIGTTEAIAGKSSLSAKKSVIIQKSPEELYRFWHNFENLPRFMNHLEAVQVLDEKRSHWVAKAPMNTTVEWDAEIIDEKENKSIVWKSLEGAEVESVGSVAFTSANGSGTKVKVTMQYTPPAGVIGAAAASLFGENPQQQLDEDLERFKQVMEASAV